MKNHKFTQVFLAILAGIFFITSSACNDRPVHRVHPVQVIPAQYPPIMHHPGMVIPMGYHLGVNGMLIHRPMPIVGPGFGGGSSRNTVTTTTTTTTKGGKGTVASKGSKAATPPKGDSISNRKGQNKEYTKRNPNKKQKAASGFGGKSKTAAPAPAQKSNKWFGGGGSKSAAPSRTRRSAKSGSRGGRRPRG